HGNLARAAGGGGAPDGRGGIGTAAPPGGISSSGPVRNITAASAQLGHLSSSSPARNITAAPAQRGTSQIVIAVLLTACVGFGAGLTMAMIRRAAAELPGTALLVF